MKFILSFSCAVLIAAVIISFLPVNREATVYDNMIRLHVIANSDSERDQELKLKVRDKVLEVIRAKSETSSDYSEAYDGINAMIPEIIAESKKVLESENDASDVSIEFGKETYPVREYDGYVLPEGKYTSLRVIIGEGNGHNWWCVLFPPICTSAAEKKDFISAGITSEGYEMITGSEKPKYKVRFRILEIFSEIFGTKNEKNEKKG